MTLKSDAEFEKKLTYCLENDFGIWQILTRALEIVKIGTFWILLPKLENVLP